MVGRMLSLMFMMNGLMNDQERSVIIIVIFLFYILLVLVLIEFIYINIYNLLIYYYTYEINNRIRPL